MHTVIVLASACALFASVCFVAYAIAGPVGLPVGALTFIPLWAVAAGVNMWMGVARAGYTVMEELPMLALVFGLPAALASLVYWRLS